MLLFSGGITHGADFSFAILDTVTMNNIQAHGTKFISANISGCKINRGRLKNSIFDNATIENSDFSNSELTKASFVKSKLTNVNFTNAKVNDELFQAESLVNIRLPDGSLYNPLIS